MDTVSVVCLKSRRIRARYYGANPSEVAGNTVQVMQMDGIQRSEPEPFLERCAGHCSHRAAGARPLGWAAPSSQGPGCGLTLFERFDDGRFLTPLGVLDRHEPPGFGVSAHLKGRGRLPRCLGCFCLPFRHVRSPQKRVSTMLTGYDALSR